jgi:hypothetical protein
MRPGQHADELAAQAAEAVRRVVAEAEERAAEILREAEGEALKIRERAEAEASQIRERAEADALDELGGTLVAAASEAIPKADTPEPESQPEPAPEPEPELDPEPKAPGAPEAPISPPAANGRDAAERLVAMKLAVEGKDPAAIEAELIEKFGPGDRSELLRDVVSRATR